MPSTSKTKPPEGLLILTIHTVMGEHQTFNNQNYSWIVDGSFITVHRKDGKWHAYFPCANVVEAEIEELRK